METLNLNVDKTTRKCITPNQNRRSDERPSHRHHNAYGLSANTQSECLLIKCFSKNKSLLNNLVHKGQATTGSKKCTSLCLLHSNTEAKPCPHTSHLVFFLSCLFASWTRIHLKSLNDCPQVLQVNADSFTWEVA